MSEALDRRWDHFLDLAQYRRNDAEAIAGARMAIEAVIRREVVDPERIAAALVETDNDAQELLDEGESLGRSFYVAVEPRARAMATLLLVASLNAQYTASQDFDPAVYELAVDDFGNQYLARRGDVEQKYISPEARP